MTERDTDSATKYLALILEHHWKFDIAAGGPSLSHTATLRHSRRVGMMGILRNSDSFRARAERGWMTVRRSHTLVGLVCFCRTRDTVLLVIPGVLGS